MLSIYKNKKVWISGHTGTKGVWLTSMLAELGAIVKGYSLPQDKEIKDNHFNLINNYIESDFNDIRDGDKVFQSIKEFEPDIIFHLAAQSLVREGYRIPQETFETNIMGSVNLLEACRFSNKIVHLVMVTTDKIYLNKEKDNGYQEFEEIGGIDPYSNSKSCVELIVNSYRKSFYKNYKSSVVTVRAGNVIIGGDFCIDRIIPDIVRATLENKSVILRNPNAIRPWQYGQDCLLGYLLLGKELLKGNKNLEGAWNFGPNKESEITVLDLVQKIQKIWPKVKYEIKEDDTLHETKILRLDSTKARSFLNWEPLYNIDKAIEQTIYWYLDYYTNNEVTTYKQIKEYLGKLNAIR